MPVYEYKCTVCQQHMDIEQSFSDDPIKTRAGCDVNKSGRHKLKKVFSAVGISFKGDGFYRNDARSGASSSSSSGGNGSASTTTDGDSTGDGGSTTDSASTTDGKSSSKSDSSSNGSSGKSDSAAKSTTDSTAKKTKSKSAAR